MRTAFFGGTFDPIHNGHLALAREVLNRGLADRILLVPAATPPHKNIRQISPFEHRLAMVRLAIRNEPGFEWSDVEMRRTGKSYTIDTLAELSASGRYGEILLLIGSDSLRQLHLWFRCHDLVRDYRMIVYPRRDETITESELRLHWSPEETEKLLSFLLVPAPEFAFSSTQIREIVKKEGIKKISELVSSAVAGYIATHRLYS